MGPVRAPVEGLVAQATRSVLASLTDAGVVAGFGLPSRDAGAESLSVWPLALMPEQIGMPGADLLRLRVRFLVVSDGSLESLPALDKALVAMASAPHLILVPEPLSVATWSALGLRPSAAVVVEVPVRVARPHRPVIRVRSGLRIGEAAIGALRGRVLGPGDVPVPGALVRVASLDISARTGGDGGFVLNGLPIDGDIPLEVGGKGLRVATQVVTGGTEPVVLHCQLEED